MPGTVGTRAGRLRSGKFHGVCFFPCNLTLGRDPLIGAASGEGLAGILLGVGPVRWHCPRQGTEDTQGGGGQARSAGSRPHVLLPVSPALPSA